MEERERERERERLKGLDPVSLKINTRHTHSGTIFLGTPGYYLRSAVFSNYTRWPAIFHPRRSEDISFCGNFLMGSQTPLRKDNWGLL